MRKVLRFLLVRPILWASARFSSRPDRSRIFRALSDLLGSILKEPGKNGLVIPFEEKSGKFILFSDQHKGRKNGADDFLSAEPNYLAALGYYSEADFYFINLGDSEELWENNIRQVKKQNKASFEAEKKFIDHNRYMKIWGNHDLYWNTSFFAPWHLRSIYRSKIKIYEGVVLPVSVGGRSLRIFCTHGHQGDAQSDGNWFSKFFVGWIWAPLQSFLRINPNTPAYDAEKKTLHNSMMYEWASAQQDLLLITGHTHQPVFESLTHLERLYKKFQLAKSAMDEAAQNELRNEIRSREKEFTSVSIDYLQLKRSYFNTGCCCFSDGDITGIEIADGFIRLVKWGLRDQKPTRQVLEEISLEEIAKNL